MIQSLLFVSAMTILTVLTFFFFTAWKKTKSRLEISTEKFNQQIEALDQSVLQAKQQLETTFDSIVDGIVVIDPDYVITRLNKTYAKFTGSNIPEILGQKCYKALRNLEHHCPECPISNMKYHDGFNCAIGERTTQIELFPTITNGTVRNYIELIRDVTRYEALNSQLRRSERLATIGTMVAGIAHEMNNPLSGISGNAQLMLRVPQKYGLGEKGLNRVSVIYESAERATKIMEDLLNFARPLSSQFFRLDLKRLYIDAVDKINPHFLKNTVIKYDFPEKPLFVWGNPEQLKSIFRRLILNSIQAIHEVQKKNPEIRGRILFSGQMKGNNILGLISDNGCGISPEIMDNIFEPFFTTKEPGKGVGLGLSLSHRIISEHFGNIKLKRLPQGTEVQIIFPMEKPKTS